MSFISKPLGWILARLSELFGNNFALSVFIFTILVNLVMLPLSLKTQKTTAKQARIKHKLDALKKKYGDDRQKYSMAMQELYTKEGISMGGGCLPMILRLLIMMGVYWAVMSPFTYVVNINKSALNAATNWSANVQVAESTKINNDAWNKLGIEEKAKDEAIIAEAEKYDSNDYEYFAKLAIIQDVKESKEKFDGDSPEGKILAALKTSDVTREVNLPKHMKNPIVESKFEEAGGKLEDFNRIDFDLFGIDLTQNPKFSWDFSKAEPNWLIPLSSFLAAIVTGVVSTIIQKKANPEAPSMMTMMLIMPLFSLYLAFTFPCAVGFYWACSSLVAGGIQIATQIFYSPDTINAKEQAKSVVKRAKIESERIARMTEEISEEK